MKIESKTELEFYRANLKILTITWKIVKTSNSFAFTFKCCRACVQKVDQSVACQPSNNDSKIFQTNDYNKVGVQTLPPEHGKNMK